jgi:predicted amidohydrolase
MIRRALVGATLAAVAATAGIGISPARAAGAGCGGPPDAVILGGGQLRAFAMQHKQDLADAASYASISRSLECELATRVDPYRATDHPNLVVFNELSGISYGTEGSRGAAARAGAPGATLVDQLIGQGGAAGIGGVAAGYTGPIAYYSARLGPATPGDVPSTVDLLFTAITDTMVRAVIENLSALARKHGVYIVFGAPMVMREGAACGGVYAGWPACPGWHRSSDPVDIAALQDPDLAPSPYVYVADTREVGNLALFFAPDGSLYDIQPKVNLTPIEISSLGWHQAAATTIHAIGLRGADSARFPALKLGVGISLDAFETAAGATACPAEAPAGTRFQPYPQFMHCLDSKGVNVFLQPEFNDGSAACMSWTDFTEDCGTSFASWQPLSWMRSAWAAVRGRSGTGFTFPNFRYAVNPFMVGNLFDISGDGQSAIFARDDPRAGAGWYSGDSDPLLYNGAGVGVYTDRADPNLPTRPYLQFEGPQPGFLGLARWVIPEASAASRYRCRPTSRSAPNCGAGGSALAPGDPGSLQSCEKGLAPNSGVTAGPCAENGYRATAVVADLFPGAPSPAAGSPAPVAPLAAGLPPTSATSPPVTVLALFVLLGAVPLARRGRRRNPS